MEETFWNGEPCKVKGILYIVGKPDIPTWWNSPLVGQCRQGLEITQGDESFIIDNEYGDAWYKVINGGTMEYSHKSIENPQNVWYIKNTQIMKKLDLEGMRKEDNKYSTWLKENHPESYQKREMLLEIMKKRNEQF